MKIELDLTVNELNIIVNWFAPQGISDTDQIIKKYELPIDPIDTEYALYELFNQLDEINKEVY